MKPEEYLMQHYRYWTIPDLGLSEDEKGYVDALRIGAEAIKEVERLRKSQCHHGWRGTHSESISTPCPTCGCKSLFIGSGGHLTCSRVPSDTGKGCDQPSVERAFEIIKAENERLRAAVARLEDHEHIPGFIVEYQALNDENDALGIENEQLKQRIAELEAYAKRDPMDDLNQTLQDGV